METHLADCLCDVRLDAETPVRYGTHEITGGALAARVASPQGGVNAFLAWAEQLTETYDRYREAEAMLRNGITADDLFEAWKRWRNRHDSKHSYFEGGHALRVFLDAGLTLEQAARYITEDVAVLVRHLTYGEVDADAYVEAEAMLRSGAPSYPVVARATGLTLDVVKHFARRLGYSTLGAQRRRDGGGFKYGADVMARCRELRSTTSLSLAAIAERVASEFPEAEGLDHHNVMSFVRRGRWNQEEAA